MNGPLNDRVFNIIVHLVSIMYEQDLILYTPDILNPEVLQTWK